VKDYLVPIENQGQRVLTTQQLAECYGTTIYVISKNFNRNADRYIKGKHYYLLEGEELKEFLHWSNCPTQNLNKVRNLYLWTEKGALLHAKSLNTDKAWEVYDILVESYFRAKEEGSKLNGGNIKAISMLHSEIGALIAATSFIESRVESLESTMTIDYSQQQLLQETAKAVAIDAMGGKGNKAYKDSSLRSKVFSTVWKDYKEYFCVNSYRNTASLDFERAKEYLKSWRAQGKLLRDIEDGNRVIGG
jgi:ORF6C domain/ORF6N domain